MQYYTHKHFDIITQLYEIFMSQLIHWDPSNPFAFDTKEKSKKLGEGGQKSLKYCLVCILSTSTTHTYKS